MWLRIQETQVRIYKIQLGIHMTIKSLVVWKLSDLS